MIEEENFIPNSDGTISLNPTLIDLIKERLDSNEINNNHIVYLFINKNVTGIKFYNLSNKNNLNFTTKRKLVFEAEWNYLMNYPNKTMIFRSDIGDIKIDTYIVSKKELFRIMNIIKKENNYDKLINFKINKKNIDLFNN